ncbi:MAG: TonB-dependent receptor [Dysgonamonadaceae bacterium]|jgi:TonB-linked SusC/RagA family outer membrane protein|nr:TonB-dependent receptor [Dysgonamonadaceae bacterium]
MVKFKKSTFKLCSYCVCVILLFWFSPVQAQTLKQNDLTIHVKNEKLKDVFAKITSISGYNFFYDEDLAKNAQEISLHLSNVTLTALLQELEKQSGCRYVVTNSTITASRPEDAANSERDDAAGNEVNYSGVVTDRQGEAIIGALVKEKETGKGTFTDIDGQFNLKVSQGAVLTISYLGYKTVEISAANKNGKVSITLEEDVQALDEVVVIAYGTAKKSDLTSSIAVMKAEEIAKVPAGVVQAIEGKMAGVTVVANGLGSSIRIRGIGTINSTEPLLVVDGIVGAFMPDNNNIKSFQVLKDAAACALYGSRGSNGVILVTTKQGEKGKTRISYNGYYGQTWATKTLDLLSSEDYIRFHQENLTINQLGGEYANGWESLPARILQAIDDPAAMAHTNWQDAIFQTGFSTKHAISVAGGSENNTYYLAGTYYKNEGIQIGNDGQGVNIQLNTSAKRGFLTIGENLNIGTSGGRSNSLIAGAIRIPALVPAFNADNLGGLDGPTDAMDRVNIGNPLASAYLNRNERKNDFASGNVYAIIDWGDFSYKGNFVARINDNNSNSTTFSAVYGVISRPYSSMAFSNGRSFFSAVENTLTWAKNFNKHNLNVMAGYTREYSQSESVSSGADKFNVREPVSYATMAADATKTLSGGFSETAMESMLGRIVYDYDGKYLLTANYRRDGSSKFGKNYRYGNFPSFSAGWRLSEEKFMEPLRASLIDNLKLRASWGVIGSDFGVGAYRELTITQGGLAYVFNNVLAPAATSSMLRNEDLHWEEQVTTDFGFDLDMWGGKLSLTADYYHKNTNSMLIAVPIAYSSGISSMTMNAGNLENKGLEFSLTGRKNTGELHLEGIVNLTLEKNKVTKLGNLNQPIAGGISQTFKEGVTRTEVDHSVGQFYGYRMLGIYQIGDTDIPAGLAPGDIRFDDMIDGVPGLKATDRTFIGSPFPDFTYGFGINADWKGFDCSVFFQGVHGNQIFNSTRYYLEGMYSFEQMHRNVLNRWTPQQPSTTMPRASQKTSSHNLLISDRFVEDAAYLRFKTLSMGYTVPEKYLQKLYIQKLRIYVSGQNLFTFTKYSGYDPEIGTATAFNSQETNSPNLYKGIDNGNYPVAGSFHAGIQISF